MAAVIENLKQAPIALAERSVEKLQRLSNAFETQAPPEVLAWAASEFGDRIALATGFGPEGMTLIDMAARQGLNLNFFYLDTGVLFPETYELRERVERKYGIEIKPWQAQFSIEEQAALYGPALWQTNPDLCCKLRKLEPLKEALTGRAAWITAIRREQSRARATAGIVEWDHKWGLIKVNPLATWTKRQVWDYLLRHDVPYNPLHDVGYPSIGCTHCTKPVQLGEDDRAGRWRGQAKTECGLHG